jgi:putative ABC transport system permease protein
VVTFTVSGILYHSLPGSTGQESAVFSEATALRRFGVDFFDVLQIIPSGASLDLHAVRQQALNYGMDVVSVDQIANAVDSGLAGLVLVLQALGAVGIAVALLGIINTMLVSVAEGRRELALLRSLGMTRRQLGRLVISEAVSLALAGAVVGAVVGTLGLVGLLRALSTSTFQPVVVLPWVAAADAAIGLILAAILAALIPARRAARGSIVEALRVET